MSDAISDQVPLDPRDVGRRIAHRREELGLTLDELAVRARIDPNYLEYLETRAGHPTAELLLRVAHALETTAKGLLGEEWIGRPGGASPVAGPASSF